MFQTLPRKSWHTVVPVLLAVVLACFIISPPRTDAAGNATLPVDPTLLSKVYGAPVDAQKILSFKDKDNKSTVRIATDQLLVTLKPEKSLADAHALAKFLGGTVIGQIPSKRSYQLRVTSRGKEELDALLTRARTHPAVHRAGYNSLVEFQACPAPCDNHKRIRGQHRCAFEDIEYYTALTLFEAARDHLTLYPVRLAVLDSGMDLTSQQFRDLKVFNLDAPGQLPIDPHPNHHGTKVISLIGASDNNYGINGIASRFLGPKLTLLVGRAYDLFSVQIQTERAAMSGADIVNLSQTIPGASVELTELFEEYPEMLFVVPMPALFDSQLGIRFEMPYYQVGMDNVVVVGGMLACSLTPLDNIDSSVTPELRAPSEDIPVLGYHDNQQEVMYVRGTSFSAPMVSSLAAILKSLNPELSPREIKTDYLQEHPMLVGPNMTYRLAMLRSLTRLLLDIDVGPPVRDWIDAGVGVTGVPATPGKIMGNVCGKTMVSVAGTGELRARPSGVYGIIRPDHTNIEWNLDPEIHGEFHAEFPIEPGTYALVKDNDNSPRGVEFRLSHFGDAVSGNLIIIEDCWITERFPDTNEPLVVNLTGRFDGVLEWHRMPREFEGYFTQIPFTMRHQMRGHPLLRYFENKCSCGTGQ